jgi:hypothetical protein
MADIIANQNNTLAIISAIAIWRKTEEWSVLLWLAIMSAIAIWRKTETLTTTIQPTPRSYVK